MFLTRTRLQIFSCDLMRFKLNEFEIKSESGLMDFDVIAVLLLASNFIRKKKERERMCELGLMFHNSVQF